MLYTHEASEGAQKAWRNLGPTLVQPQALGLNRFPLPIRVVRQRTRTITTWIPFRHPTPLWHPPNRVHCMTLFRKKRNAFPISARIASIKSGRLWNRAIIVSPVILSQTESFRILSWMNPPTKTNLNSPLVPTFEPWTFNSFSSAFFKILVDTLPIFTTRLLATPLSITITLKFLYHLISYTMVSEYRRSCHLQ